VFCPVDGVRLVNPVNKSTSDRRSDDSLIGLVLNDRYKIIRRIGEGGMGIIYEAEHLMIEKRVALKALREDISSRQGVLERFRIEARSASKIGHPHIVDISDFGETPSGAAYYVMEMLDGEDLADILFRDNKLKPSRATKIVYQCCQALGAAHSKGIIHRDIKPENIFITQRDRGDFVKIVDFGVAKMNDIEIIGRPQRKLTKTGLIFGTPEYMSPEHARGLPLDHRVDIYALGIILYESLTGRVPFEGENFMEVLSKHWNEPVPPFSRTNPSLVVSEQLEAVVLKALEKDPKQRYASMGRMAKDLARVPEMSGTIVSEERVSQSIPDTVAETVDAPTIEASESIRAEDIPTAAWRTPRFRTISVRRWATAGFVLAISFGIIGASYGILKAGKEPQTTSKVLNDHQASITITSLESGPELKPADGTAPEGKREPRTGIEPVETVQAQSPVDWPTRSSSIVHVTTQPQGARISVRGRGQVCAATPCQFETSRARAIWLRAELGQASATKILTPSEASTTLHFKLVSGNDNPGVADKKHNRSIGSKQRQARGDLKIPDIFVKN
jgi:serine/threonine protein kinase